VKQKTRPGNEVHLSKADLAQGKGWRKHEGQSGGGWWLQEAGLPCSTYRSGRLWWINVLINGLASRIKSADGAEQTPRQLIRDRKIVGDLSRARELATGELCLPNV
jgi:hypothetical protein